MAKINPVKVRQDADKLEKAGRLDQAIALYRQIVEDNPRDWNTINKIGDLFAKLNRIKEASGEYAKVADFYAKDGFLLKAIAIWKKINKLDPTILDPYLNLADLYGKQGLMMEAKGQYQVVVDEYVKRGRTREAGDVLKRMAEIDPGDLKVRSRLADLYTREGNAAKAVDEHVAIAEELNKKGHLAEAVQVLEKGLKIDPKSYRLRLELGRVYLVQKNHERAAHYLEEAVQSSPNDPKILVRLGEAYVGAKKIEEAEAIFKRLLELDPNDQESRVQMGRVYLMQGQFDRAFEGFLPIVDKLVDRREGDKAAALLQQITQKNPQHVRTLQKLIDIYRGLQKDAAVIQTYSQLTEAFIKLNQFDQAASVCEILVSMEPQNQQHKTKLQFVRSRLSGAPAAPPAAARRAGAPAQDIEMEEEFDVGPAPEPPSPAGLRSARPAAAPVAAAPTRPPLPKGGGPSIELSGPLGPDDSEFVEEHLAEGRVFRKYGLVDKAADQFEAIIARFADNVDARQELRDLYRDKAQPAKAAEHVRALAEICRLKGDAKGAAAHEEEAAQLVPSGVPRPGPARPAAPSPAPAAMEEEEISLSQNEEEVLLEVEESGLQTPALTLAGDGTEPLLGEELGQSGELPQQFIEEEGPAAEAHEQTIDIPLEEEMLSEAAEAPFSVEEELTFEEPPPPPVPKPAPAPKPAAPAAAKPAKVPPPPPPPPKAAPVKPAPAPVAKAEPPPKPGLPADLQKLLDEVDSYIAVGFVDDAREALRDTKGRFASHPAFMAKMAELGVEEEAPSTEDLVLEMPKAPPPSPPKPSRVPPPPPAAVSSDDLLGELGVEEPVPEEEMAFESAILDEEPVLPEPPPPPPRPAAPPARARPAPRVASLSVEDLVGQASALPAESQDLDLGSELGGLFEAQSAVEEAPAASSPAMELGDKGLAEIFKEFKAGVDRQLGKEDYDTRYNLGIAYKEMGLVDEAIAEFQLAAKDETRALECSSMLGLCFMEKGMPKLAIKWFERGLGAPGRTDEEYLGLRYDLAAAHEASGDTDAALSLFTELYGQNANFRDVAEKVRQLGGVV